MALIIFGFENTPANLLVGLKKILADQFSHFFSPVNIHSQLVPIPEKAYNSSRRQYEATPFLSALDSQVPPNVHGLALVNLDLFVPKLNFIFGVAQPGGNALVALPRLRPSFYQLPINDAIYFQRIVKEALHELGHVLGLGHCSNYCVMRFSNTLAHTDDKPTQFCQTCDKMLAYINT